MKTKGTVFQNSDVCKGVVYSVENGSVDISSIDITGRYPDQGWAVNEKVHEMVYVQNGAGSLEIRGLETQSLKEGDVVSVLPGQRFAWDGDMTIIMACSPPFSPEQYKLEDDNEI